MTRMPDELVTPERRRRSGGRFQHTASPGIDELQQCHVGSAGGASGTCEKTLLVSGGAGNTRPFWEARKLLARLLV